jgi:two-component system, chemotaxis family, chemotaxis protein CheY
MPTEKQMKVLVVDDDVVSRMVLMHLIDACGSFDILEAEDGEDAWQQLAAGLRPDICFCDLRMPRLSGMDLLQRVKADSALGAMPFVMVTSATDSATIDKAAGLGVNGYLVKPFKGDDVQTYMAPFALGPSPATESPQASMARLGISGERLLVYLGGFQSQLTSASADIAALLARGDDDGARLRIERLHAGCLTLGLNGAAAAMNAFPPGRIDNAQVQLVLADTVRDVMHQSEAVKRAHAPA